MRILPSAKCAAATAITGVRTGASHSEKVNVDVGAVGIGTGAGIGAGTGAGIGAATGARTGAATGAGTGAGTATGTGTGPLPRTTIVKLLVKGVPAIPVASLPEKGVAVTV